MHGTYPAAAGHRTPPAEADRRPAPSPAGRDPHSLGERCDVLRVPEPAGRWALRRLLGYRQPALMPGPVALTADGAACLFFVAPGAEEDLPELLEWLDWGGIDLGLRAYPAGAPLPEAGEWLHDPGAPAPEVVALLATIAECASRRMLRRSVPDQRPITE